MKTLHSMQSIYRTVLVIMLYSLFALSPVYAETTNCTAITSLPYTITSQGVYCFTGNLGTGMTSGNAITINVNNVTIDMNGYKLGGLAAGDNTTAIGIYANQRKNITLRNGIIRGFKWGIWFQDSSPYTASQGHLIEDILADQNTYAGLLVQGRGMTIRRNQVVDTGGSTNTFQAYGMIINGPGNDVLSNRVVKTASTGSTNAFGIYLFSVNNSVVQANQVVETTSPTGDGLGILIVDSSDVIARDNIITVADFGLRYSTSTGLYSGNYINNTTTPYLGGTAAGSTNFSN